MDDQCSILDNLEKVLNNEDEKPCAVSLQFLRDITTNFSGDCLLGDGAFGEVYKGSLPNEKTIAVKKLRSKQQCQETEFKKELDTLMRVSHKNIVRLVGYCCETQKIYEKFNGDNVLAETTKMLLCFEYMPNKSLDNYISDESCGLDWHQRYEIIKGICYGLLYLHNECQKDSSLVHLDLKPENILLDYNLAPKIADFGLAKLFDDKKTHTYATHFAGSLGYMSPEYIYGLEVSPMADIYSFGVIIIQMITGHRHGPSGTEGFRGDFVEPVLQKWRKRLETRLTNVSLETSYQQIKLCLDIGLTCIQYDKRKRPTIEEIIEKLSSLENSHCHVKTDGRPQVVQRYRERIYREDSGFRADDIYMDFKILERIVDGSEEPTNIKSSLLNFITDNFSEELRIGRGGFGDVYMGILQKEIIAVRKLFSSHTMDDKMFNVEVRSMMMVNHPNIVRFLGYCSETKGEAINISGKIVMADIRERFICFEYLKNGSLDNYISDELRGLEWQKRYQIIKGICEALHYLHKEKHIIHMDLKPANILLDEHMVPKVTDLGLSRLDAKSRTMSTGRFHSLGYCDPEYMKHGKMSTKSDIYSLGVVILELVTGSKNEPSINKVLRRWSHRWNKSARGRSFGHLQVTKCIDLALRCMNLDPRERPNIWDIISELNEVDTLYLDMIGIEPLEIHLPFQRNKQMSSSIKLTNDTDDYCAFRISTTSERQYHINPNNDIIPPRSKYSVTITMQALEEAPPYCRDEFTVQSTRVDGSLTAMDITEAMFIEGSGKVVDDVNVLFVVDTFSLPSES